MHQRILAESNHHAWWVFLTSQPGKQQLDNDIPAACKAINAILMQLQKATSWFDQFIAHVPKGSRDIGGPNINQDGWLPLIKRDGVAIVKA